jgi:hypothetical protein
MALKTDVICVYHSNYYSHEIGQGRAMAQAVCRQPLTAEARDRVRVSPCVICGGQWHWDRFFSEFFGFLLSILFHHFSILIYHHPTRCATALTNQHIIIPSDIS